MNHLAYQRFVFGYHGCDASVAENAIQTGNHLAPSENDYDWLGKGIYFWEHGPDRALEWAKDKMKRGEIKKPAVVGALIHLGKCFDLLDTQATSILSSAFEEFQQLLSDEGKQIPKNSEDELKRKRDCALLNYLMELFSKYGVPYQTVRGVLPKDHQLSRDQESVSSRTSRLLSEIRLASSDIFDQFRPCENLDCRIEKCCCFVESGFSKAPSNDS